MAEQEIGIAEAIKQLRSELQEAVAEGEGKDLRFDIQEIEVELKCHIKNEVGGSAGVKFWIVNTEAKASNTSEAVQTVRLKLLLQDDEGKSPLLSSTDQVE